jgi:hypothetical protein
MMKADTGRHNPQTERNSLARQKDNRCRYEKECFSISVRGIGLCW